ncbi:MAG: M3 family oligoendopeptidase [Clostridia bacterium]|nr:M3 family oligoendopeptidase [Clostridia bacterium]
MTDFKFPSLEYVRPNLDDIKNMYVTWTNDINNAKDYDTIKSVMLKADTDIKPFETMLQLAYIRNTLNTADKFYEDEMAFFNENLPLLAQVQLGYSMALYNSPFKKELEAEYGTQLFSKIELQKKSFCEKNIPLMQKESQLTTEYQKIMGTCAIDFNGQTLNLYGITKYFENDDRNLREAAYKAYSNFYSSNEKRLEEIWDELIKIRNEMGRNLGFENFIPLGYMQQGRTDYGPDDVASFRDQVKEVLVPLCKKLYDAQAKRLGIDHVMAWDEKRVFADGNAHPIGDDDFMVATAQKMYHKISAETGEFIDFMIDHELLDLKNKPGKAATGYMTSLDEFKAPFVFSVFNGTIGDMQVLTHELGHAFAGYMAMRNQPISDYYSESTDIAEIHSMSMEQFAYPYAEDFFGADADKYRFAHLQEAITFVPFGVAVDEFQHICYMHPELTPKERTYEWHKLEEKYMPWRKYGGDEFMERGGYWYHKLHIFLYPMYYINYTLTTMGAMEFKKKMAEDKDKAWSDYLNLCKTGGSRSYLNTLKFANVSNPFLSGSVEKATSYAKEILLKEIED